MEEAERRGSVKIQCDPRGENKYGGDVHTWEVARGLNVNTLEWVSTNSKAML